MTYTWAVTYEYDTKPPETVRGEIVSYSPFRAARRAVLAAKRARPGLHPRSLSILVERVKRDAAKRTH